MNDVDSIKPITHKSIGESLNNFLNKTHFDGAIEIDDKYRKMFKDSILDHSKNYPAPVPVININQNNELIPFLTLKSFSLWQGKQKSKKTTALALTVAAFMQGANNSDENTFQGAIDGTCIFIDNEQGESYAARTMKLILSLAGLQSSPKLIYCDLREYSPKERIKIIQAAIECTPNVKLVVIDGLVDLLTDFMDAGEGHLTITDILKLCSLYDIHIAGVLHQNKNDKNARAHVGTIASQKCEVEISTDVDTNDRAQSIVSCINSRGMPFEPFAIRWDKGCLPCVSNDWNASVAEHQKATKSFNKGKEIAEAIFTPLASLSHSESISSIRNIIMKSESTAKRMLDDFQFWGYITKGEDGKYRKNMSEGSRVQKGSNEPI